MTKLCSLRQHDLDQVIRVKRGSLLSVPHRGTPRSIVLINILDIPSLSIQKNTLQSCRQEFYTCSRKNNYHLCQAAKMGSRNYRAGLRLDAALCACWLDVQYKVLMV